MNTFNKSKAAAGLIPSMVFALAVVLFLSLGFTPFLSAEGVIQLPRTGQTISYAAGDDGDLQVGVAWPDPRFTDHENGSATDHLTGLMWVTDANLMASRDPDFDTDGAQDGSVTWIRALDYVAKLNAEVYLGFSDWRLPNIRELASLIDHSQANPCLPVGHPFENVAQETFSSTSRFRNLVWGVRFFDFHSNARSGEVSALAGKRDQALPVWPVRTSISSGAIRLPRTGEGRSLVPGDDGDVRAGELIPNPRFIDRGNGTVSDRLTGLMWPQDQDAFTGADNWEEALAKVAQLNSESHLGHSDWRLPNRLEAWSLIDFSEQDPAVAGDHPFVNLDNSFWATTTDASDADDVFDVSILRGASSSQGKGHLFSGFWAIWPVRTDTTPLSGHAVRGQVTMNGVPMEGLTVTLDGDLSAEAVTNAEGRFAFTFLPDGTYTATCEKLYHAFTPDHREIVLQGTDQDGVDFTAELSAEFGWVDMSDRLTRFFADLSDVHFVSRDEGWITSSNRPEIYHTTDGGRTWEVQTTLLTCNTLHMRDALEGYAGGASGFIYRTLDGGKNWVFAGTLLQTVADIEFPPVGEIGYACGLNGSIASIQESGVQRMTSSIPDTVYSLSFPVNSDQGWVCGGSIILTYLGGIWSAAPNDYPSGGHNAIYMVDNLIGWTVGDSGLISHTDDGSEYLRQTNPDSQANTLFAVDFLSIAEGWAVGSSGMILHTTNAGEPWEVQAKGLTQNTLISVFAVDSETIYAVGNDGTFFKYTRLEPPVAYTGPLTLTGLFRTPDPDVVTLTWEPATSQATLEFSSDLKTWQPLAENLSGTSWTGAVPGGGCLRLRWEVGEP